MTKLNRLTIERLMLYYQYIRQLAPEKGSPISSGQFARYLSIDDTQVRKDLAAVGIKGRRRVGFDANQVHKAIREVLGLNSSYPAVVIGAGRLCGSIASYKGFTKHGLDIVALFDINPDKIGFSVGGHIVQPMEQLESLINDRNVLLGILTVPADAAQQLADRLVSAGIKAIWNFSAVGLTLPQNIIVRDEHLSLGLAHLCYHLKQTKDL